MTQEDKELLLRDLSSRLPYGVKVCYLRRNNHNWYTLEMIDISDDEVYISTSNPYSNEFAKTDDVKPYLFPLSSMTDEMWDKEFRGCDITEFTRDSFKYGCETLEFSNSNPNLSNTVNFINKLIKNHFDYLGLIPKGLALDATGLGIY